MANKILLVEDESSIRGFVKINFQHHDYTVIEAETGEEGIRQAQLHNPDIAILDIMLPGISGFEVCHMLRQEFPNIGIIMLTAKSQDNDKITGLKYGADDYIVKPFNIQELLLRVKALVRRVSDKNDIKDAHIIKTGSFTIDKYAQKVYKSDIELDLTPTEYLMMKVFVERAGKALSRDELLDLVWGINFIGDFKVVDVNVRRLRAKIEETGVGPKYIETIWGKGYRWSIISDKN